MDRTLRCPNCGGEHVLSNPGITMLVCKYCKTTVYWDAESVLKTGAQSILPEADTRLFANARGKLLGRDFEVVGHLRYDYGRGTWDEWYLQLGDGGVAWLSEDERELSLEQASRLDRAVPPAAELRPGQTITVEGVPFTVRELGQATCLGGEGQLPFAVLPGESYPYADLASVDGTQFATLEYEGGTTPRAYAGRVLTHAELVIEDEAPPSTAGSHEGKHLRCANCQAPVSLPPDREVKTLVCEYCGAQHDLSGAEARVAGMNPQGFDPGFLLSIGQAGTLLGQRYEVCGRTLYQDPEGYTTREYLLFNKDAGYLWLTCENGHYVLNRPTQQAPQRDPFTLVTKQQVTAGRTSFRMYEQGLLSLVYVDGALPWRAVTGDRLQYADLTAPPYMLSVEREGNELEYFHGTYLSGASIWTAFGLAGRAPSPDGVHPAQPFVRGPVARALMIVGGIFALINLGLLGWSCAGEGTEIHSESFQSSQYAGECLSRPFVIGPQPVMSMRVSAPLNNSWIGVNVALVNSDEQVIAEMEDDLCYYHGVDEGESWSEGSSDHETFFKAPTPGTYRLLLQGTGGSGETGAGPSRGEPLTVRLSQGAVLSRYFLAAFLFAFLFPFFELTRQHLFEKRRWAPVTEDDDDDD